MPIYKITPKESDKTFLVKATSAAKALRQVVKCEAIDAEQLATEYENGAKLEPSTASSRDEQKTES